jgi:hypothetical protein
MPPRERGLDGSKGTFEGARRQRVKTIAALSSKQSILRVWVLYQEKPRVKFHKYIIVGCKTMNGNEIFLVVGT